MATLNPITLTISINFHRPHLLSGGGGLSLVTMSAPNPSPSSLQVR